jgi:hypothetical protein
MMATREVYRSHGLRKICNALAVVSAAALALMVSTAVEAATITVDSLADTGAPGICVLRDAITAANTMTATNGCVAGTGNDRIQFRVTGTIALASTLPQITDSHLTIHGPPSPGITIDGGSNVQTMVIALGAKLNFNHLTIANGHNRTVFGFGGGIENEGTLTVVNSTFSGNNASEGFGGGIGNNGGTLKVANSAFSGNNASYGGGIDNNFGTVTVTNSIFSGNITDHFYGGGIENDSGTLTVTKSIFSHNRSIFFAGGIGNFGGGTLTVTNSSFFGNSGGGGGIGNNGTGTIANSTFSRNNGECAGGGIEHFGGTLTVTNSTFVANSSGSFGHDCDGGGGIFNISRFATLIVINSTFSGNSTIRGPITINNAFGTVTVTNSTIRGAITNNPSAGHGTLTLKSTILAGGGHKCAGMITDGGYNISNDSSCGFSATGSRNNSDPQLDPAGLSHNGGKTRTIALLSGSPAIDAIPVADCTDQASPPNPIQFDQRGFPRPDNGENACDIGAYEFQDTP